MKMVVPYHVLLWRINLMIYQRDVQSLLKQQRLTLRGQAPNLHKIWNFKITINCNQILSGNSGLGERPLDNPTLLHLKCVQELPSDSTLFTAKSYSTIATRAVNFAPDYGKAINSISVCVQTEVDNEDNTMTSYLANPHCLKGGILL